MVIWEARALLKEHSLMPPDEFWGLENQLPYPLQVT